MELGYDIFRDYVEQVRACPPSFMSLGMEYGVAWTVRVGLSSGPGLQEYQRYRREIFSLSIHDIIRMVELVPGNEHQGLCHEITQMAERILGRWNHHWDHYLESELGECVHAGFGDGGDATHWFSNLTGAKWQHEWGYTGYVPMTELLDPLWARLVDLAGVGVHGVDQLKAGATASVAYLFGSRVMDDKQQGDIYKALRKLLVAAGARVPRPGRATLTERLQQAVELTIHFASKRPDLSHLPAVKENAVLTCDPPHGVSLEKHRALCRIVSALPQPFTRGILINQLKAEVDNDEQCAMSESHVKNWLTAMVQKDQLKKDGPPRRPRYCITKN